MSSLIDQLTRKNTDAIRGCDLILPASFGGIERGVGMLDAAAPTQPADADRADEPTKKAHAAARRVAPDVADARGRYREREDRDEAGNPVQTPLTPESVKPPNCFRYSVEVLSDDDHTVRLVSYVPKTDKPELGREPQTLKQHVGAVRTAIDRILASLSPGEDIRLAAQLAADFHDHGKDRREWQHLLIFPNGYIKPDEPMGKSGHAMKRDRRGYRHEFGSLREFTDAFKDGALRDPAGRPIPELVFDLAMHLIATHHGRGRPHFPRGAFDPQCEARSDELHTESIRRFARLQRKYGWWHLAWLENLLRCADAMASKGLDTEDEAGNHPGAYP